MDDKNSTLQQKLELLGGSDHLARFISVTPEPSDSGAVHRSVQGGTLNLLECCFNKKPPGSFWGYANNPFDYLETPNAFVGRKSAQFDLITSAMQSRDFFAIQEVDFLSPNWILDEAKKMQPSAKITEQQIVERIKLAEGIAEARTTVLSAFEMILQAKNLGYVAYKERKLAIVYNTTSLTPIENSLKTHLIGKGGVGCMFTHDFRLVRPGISSNKIVTIGSMHGDFKENYAKSLPTLFAGFVQSGNLTIIAGDTNHPAEYENDGALTLENDISNFNTNYADCQEGYTNVLFQDERDASHTKSYNAFYVIAPKGMSAFATVSGLAKWDKSITSEGTEEVVKQEINSSRCFKLFADIPYFQKEESYIIFAKEAFNKQWQPQFEFLSKVRHHFEEYRGVRLTNESVIVKRVDILQRCINGDNSVESLLV